MDDLTMQHAARDLIEKRLAEIFEERGRLTHRDIATECGLSQSVVSLYIRGFIMEARFKQMVIFLNWLGISPNELAQAVELYAPALV